jgi:hypothetical protein
MILIFRHSYYFCSFFLLLLYKTEISNCLSTKVLVVGSVNADITIDVEEYPKQCETVVAKDTPESGSLAAGGKGANQAVACRRLGVDTIFLCQFGKDGYSNFLESKLIKGREKTKQLNIKTIFFDIAFLSKKIIPYSNTDSIFY